jgi:lysophospholipid acyltransferase (LPLAT)-like uncharacterized protein
LACAYLRGVGVSSKIVWINRSVRDELEAKRQGFIYAFWHGRQVFLVYLHRQDKIFPLVSHSRDGELIARISRSFGIEAVRGSTSRGGMEALLQLKTILDAGNRVGFTPDGPKGPLREVQPGVLFLAQKLGRPIVPVAYGARRRWVFKGSWDEFVVPKPFNRISMVYGSPIYVDASADLTRKAAELKDALDAVTREADRQVTL